jgi:hypothetical protein
VDLAVNSYHMAICGVTESETSFQEEVRKEHRNVPTPGM